MTRYNPGTMMLALILALAFPSTDLGAARDLKILYAGAPDSPRTASFERFLEQWFEQVDTIPLVNLTPKRAEPYDVVVADWKRRYTENDEGKYRFDSSTAHGASLDDSFTKPIVMIGAVAGELFRASQPKVGWL